MFKAEFWKSGTNITVELFCKYLQENIPPQEIICVCGNSHIYMHMEEDGSAFSIDDSSLSDLPEYEGYDAINAVWTANSTAVYREEIMELVEKEGEEKYKRNTTG